MLSRIESTACWTVWMCSGVYILYCFSLESTARLPLLDKSDFSGDWKIIGRPKDTSDEEWSTFKEGVYNYWPWLACHLLLKFISKHLLNEYKDGRAFLYVTYSLFSMGFSFGLVVPLLYLAVVSVGIFLCIVRSKILNYFTIFFLLYFLHGSNLHFIKYYAKLQNYQFILVELGFSWLIARLLSVSLDMINNQGVKCILNKLPAILAYCFYLPLFYTGPIVSYDNFCAHFYQADAVWNINTFCGWFKKVLKYVLYILILEFLLHFLYSTSIQYYPQLADQMDAWTLCGLGYSLSMLFYLKYLIIYGIGGVLAEFDNLSIPPPPKCISRINLNSKMWKYFDRGLYLWITRYLYIPIVGQTRSLPRRLIASICCFAFMTLWHGMHKAIFLWCFLNCLAVSIEMLVSKLYTTYLVEWRMRNISESNFIRCKTFFGALSFLHLCLSCMLFLSNWEIGMVFYKKILFGFPVPLLPTLLIMYAESFVAFEYEEMESQLIKKSS